MLDRPSTNHRLCSMSVARDWPNYNNIEELLAKTAGCKELVVYNGFFFWRGMKIAQNLLFPQILNKYINKSYSKRNSILEKLSVSYLFFLSLVIRQRPAKNSHVIFFKDQLEWLSQMAHSKLGFTNLSIPISLSEIIYMYILQQQPCSSIFSVCVSRDVPQH